MIIQRKIIPVFNIIALTLVSMLLWSCAEETLTEAPPKEEVSQPEALQFSEYLPGQPGSFWKYAAPNGTEVTRTVTGIEQAKTATYIVLKSEPAPQSKPTDEKTLIVQTLLELPNVQYRGTSGGDVVINASDLKATVDSMLRKKFNKNIKASKNPSISLPSVEWTLIKAPLSEGADWEVMLGSVSGVVSRKKEQGDRTAKGGKDSLISSTFSGAIEIRARATAKDSIKIPTGTFDAIKVDYKLITRELNPDQDTPDITTEDLLTHWIVPGIGIVQSASKDGNTWQLVAFEIK